MILHLKILAVLLAAFAFALSGSAQAQEISLSYGSATRRGSFAVTLGYPSLAHRRQAWVPGHYETVCERVWVPGAARRVWVPQVCETRYDACGRAYTVIVRAGYWHTAQERGRYETRNVRRWVPGGYGGHYGDGDRGRGRGGRR